MMKDSNWITFERREGSLLNPLGVAGIIFIFIMGVLAIGNKNPRFLFLILPVMILLILPELAKKSLLWVGHDKEAGDIVVVLNKWGGYIENWCFPLQVLTYHLKMNSQLRIVVCEDRDGS